MLGGRARSISTQGKTLDNGQHILLGAYAETLALMRQIGANPDVCFTRHPLAVIDNAGFRMVLPNAQHHSMLPGATLRSRRQPQ